jgi:hypothetical protein
MSTRVIASHEKLFNYIHQANGSRSDGGEKMKVSPFFPGFLLVAFLLLLTSCSTGSGSSVPGIPTSPGLSGNGERPGGEPQRYLWAWYFFRVDPENNIIEPVPVRSVEDHWNALRWLEGGPCTDCVKVLSFTDSGFGTKLADVEITHPFPNANLTGFDVRGIAMFDGSFEFTELGAIVPDRYSGDGELVNADGYTRLYNSTTEGSGPNGLQGYIKGHFSTLTAPNATLNGFKRHVSDDPANTRNAFYAGDSVTVTYEIDMPDSAFVFGYAVDACWVPATTKPVTDPMTDFPPEANCPEPWKVDFSFTPLGVGFTDKGGGGILTADVYDHQGKDTHKAPVIEIPYLGTFTFELEWKEDAPEYTRYETLMTIFGGGFPPGIMEFLAAVEDNENETSPEWLDLTAYQRASTEVTIYEYNGWAKTWGGANWDGGGMDVATDYYGNAYVVGEFQETVDFDPGDGVEERVSNGSRDAYLAKFDSNGALVWVRTWGGAILDSAYGVAVNTEGDPFVTGAFNGTVDFDPGSGVEEHNSVGSGDGYVSSFDRDGNFKWVSTWGDINYDSGWAIAVDYSSYVYATGSYNSDIYITKFSPDGSFGFGTIIGGAGSDNGRGISRNNDGRLLVGGSFEGTVDFDPDPVGEDIHVGAGSLDAFLCSFDKDGDFLWAKTWGSTGLDEAMDVEIHGINTIFAVGRFDGSVDFDPDPVGEEIHDSAGWQDAFMSKFDGDGEFEFAKTWGAPGAYLEWEYAEGVAIGNTLDVYVCGRFGTTVDFDPGSGTTELASNGVVDAYVVKFNVLGGFQWARGWGGLYEDAARRVAVNQLGDVFVTGYYWNIADFDPSGDVDVHTSNGQQDVFLSKFTPEGEW